MKSALKLASYLKPYRRWVVLAPLLMLLEVVMDLLQPRLLERVVDQGIAQGDMALVIHTGLWMVGLACVGLVGGVSNGVFTAFAAQGFGADLREALFRKVHTLSFANLDELQTGQLVTRLTNDVTQVQDAVSTLLGILIRAPLLLVGSLVMALVTAPQLAFLPLSLIPVLLVVVVWLGWARPRQCMAWFKASWTPSTRSCRRTWPAFAWSRPLCAANTSVVASRWATRTWSIRASAWPAFWR